MSEKSKKVTLFSLVAFVAASVFLILYVGWQFSTTPSSYDDQDVIYEVKPGTSFSTVSKNLEELGVVKNAEAFSMFARVTNQRSKLKVGEYKLNKNLKPQEVLDILKSGKSIARAFTVSEGLNIFDIAKSYEAQGFGRAIDFMMIALEPTIASSFLKQEVTSLEGYLYPETYQITKYTTTKELIAAMVQRFQTVWREVEKKIPAGNKLSKHQIVTLASIIEKETGASFERPKISSVFHNRFKKRMRLQTDPTIIYGIALDKRQMPTNISKADLLRPHPYNSYLNDGLPPGPIANPGKESLLAALYPAETGYLFFVSKNDGTHIFSETYEKHNAAVRSFQLDPKARQGKSWRDLNKNQ